MFFSVKVPMKIGNRSFRTCICYKLDENLKSTVQKLASEGKAEIYTEVRFFCNGKLVEKTKNKAKAKKRETKQKVETNQVSTEICFASFPNNLESFNTF